MCSADSRPSAVFKWFLNGALLSDTGSDLSLMNVQISQSGNYSCQAFNDKTLSYEMSQPSVVSVLGKFALRGLMHIRVIRKVYSNQLSLI